MRCKLLKSVHLDERWYPTGRRHSFPSKFAAHGKDQMARKNVVAAFNLY